MCKEEERYLWRCSASRAKSEEEEVENKEEEEDGTSRLSERTQRIEWNSAWEVALKTASSSNT